MGLFTGQPWVEQADGTFVKEGSDNNGHKLVSSETESNGLRDRNHVHIDPDHTYSVKVNKSNTLGTREVVQVGIWAALTAGSGDDYTTTRPD
jgi:hypothetical protein